MTTQEGPGPSTPQNIAQALEQRSRAEIDAKTRQDMKGNPNTQQVDTEIQYRQAGEAEAAKSLSEAELTVAWKFKMSASEYVRGKR